MRHWQDKGARRVWRWILLVYATVALILTAYAMFTSPSEAWLAPLFLIAAAVLLLSPMLRRVELTWVVALLFSPVLVFGLVSGKYYVDGVAARSQGVFRIVGIPIIIQGDGELTPYYREYINEDLPPPMWLPCFSGKIGLGSPHVDYFTQGIASADSELGSIIKYYHPAPAVERKIVMSYFGALRDTVSNDDRFGATLVSMYAVKVEEYFRENDGQVKLEELPTTEQVRTKLGGELEDGKL